MGTDNAAYDAYHSEFVNKAMKAVTNAAAKAASDPNRLAYHFMSPSAWINDPNGLIFFKGEYHMFYQIHPYSAGNGPKHWGHAKSTDLVHWEHLPIVLAPTLDYEANGCFSGTAVDDNGVFTLIYTGNVVQDKRKKQVQCIATSEDGVTFRKYAGNPVIRDFPAEGSVDFRDPKVWRHNDQWYMAVGSGKDGKGNALLYRSSNLYDWTYVGKMAESRSAEEGIVWNCPDFFRIGDKDVLLVSPAVWEGGKQYVRKTLYYIGRMDYETGTFHPETAGDIDSGWDFYAPQTLADDQGRIVLFGWMDMWFNSMPSKDYGWAGAMTLPREVFLTSEGKLGFRPARELERLREDETRFPPSRMERGAAKKLAADGDVLELSLSFDARAGEEVRFNVRLRESADGGHAAATVTYDGRTRELVLHVAGTAGSGDASGWTDRCELRPSEDGSVRLRLFLDRSSLEAFANDGEAVITRRLYPDAGSIAISLHNEGAALDVGDVCIWKLRSIW
jgi:beta-fructofuranosidase